MVGQVPSYGLSWPYVDPALTDHSRREERTGAKEHPRSLETRGGYNGEVIIEKLPMALPQVSAIC
jgi:hypothetical protein